MYYLYGYKYIVSCLRKLLKIHGDSTDLQSQEFVQSYHQFLMSESVFTRPIEWSNTLVIDYPTLHSHAKIYYEERREHYDKNSPVLSNRIQDGFFQQAFADLSIQQVEIYRLVCFLIKIVVVNHLKSYTNGTTNETLGLSIMDFKDKFEAQDFIELLVHQMVHMATFIADRVEPQMVLENKDIMIPTSLKFVLGGNKFPAYLAFHSYVVGVEILLFRQQTNTINFVGNYHGETPRIVRVVLEFQKSLLENQRLFTSTGLTMLHSAVNVMGTFTELAYV